MSGWLSEFHFLRPQWLLALLPLLWVAWRMVLRGGSEGAWRRIMDSHLAARLLSSGGGSAARWPVVLFALVGIAAIIALAGPAWNKQARPVMRSVDARVIVLDLSASMDATDITPSRLERARLKAEDILSRTTEGQTALVAFAGQPFVVSPLTRDADTISAMLSALSTNTMPVQGGRVDLALERSVALIEGASRIRGEVVYIGDSAGDGRALDAARELADKGFRLHVLAVGTPEGAPIPLPNGGFLSDQRGNIVVPGVDHQALAALAQAGNGIFTRMSATEDDLNRILLGEDADPETESTDRDDLLWREEGPWIVLFLLPLAALAFRRGWLACAPIALLFSLGLGAPQTASADSGGINWADLWARPDQQAWRALQSDDHQRAAELAESKEIRGSAHYRNGDFSAAARAFTGTDNADGYYNEGNALAKSGKLEEALAAYDEALTRVPDMEDALYNRKLVEEALKQQQEQEQQQQDGEGEQEESESDSSDQQQQQQQDQQNQSGEESDQQSEQEQQQGEQPQQAEGEQGEEELTELEQDEMSEEERQAMEQWLRRIPDDPGGLLRRKFARQYQRDPQVQPGEEQPW